MSADSPQGLLGDIDPPRPVRASGGHLVVSGWCLASGAATPPAVRLRVADRVVAAQGGIDRSDVSQFHPQEPAAPRCGFRIEADLPPGIHLAECEAELAGAWRSFQTLCIASEAAPLSAGLDAPASTGTITSRVYIEGWALHPDQPARELSLRYGHQEIACDPGLPRSDLPPLFPSVPHAATAGFKSRLILSAGRGPLRLRARLADGTTAIARTSASIDVRHDENVGSEIDLATERVALPRSGPATVDSPASAARPLNVAFVLHGSFAANSALHVAALANQLVAAGHDCAVLVTHDLETLQHHRHPRFRALAFADADQLGFGNGRPADVIHAWTTREHVRQLATHLRARHGARLVVHLEDNEALLLAQALGRSPEAIAAMPPDQLATLVPPDLSHPRLGRAFLESADGVTVVIDTLREFGPAGRPVLTLTPAADDRHFFPRPAPEAFRSLLRRSADDFLLFYHGNVHASNAAEMRELYAAVAQLNETGAPVTLIRTGRDAVNFLGELRDRVAPHVLSLGQVLHHHHLPELMAVADAFVQPGRDDAFNRYRFPSKLPEFFALGRPVVLPRTNLGATLRDGVDALVLDEANAAGIAAAVRRLHSDPALRRQLADGAAAVSRTRFSWARSAEALANFYARLTT